MWKLRFDLFREIERNLLTDIEIQGLKSFLAYVLCDNFVYKLAWDSSLRVKKFKHQLPINAHTQAVFTISSHSQPRERSIIGFASPCMIGPVAVAPARRSVIL